MTRLRACVICGTPSPTPRCARHTLRNRPRGQAFEPTRQAIAQRDHWTCSLCGKPINPTLRKPHPQALHIDHIVRLADGGTDDAANLRATHATCNTARRD